MGKPEAQVEYYLRDRCKAQGWLCYKFTSPGTNGVPDRVIIANNGRVCFVETKRPGGKPTPLQVKRIRDIRARGVEALVIDSRGKVDEFIPWFSGEGPRPEWCDDLLVKSPEKA